MDRPSAQGPLRGTQRARRYAAPSGQRCRCAAPKVPDPGPSAALRKVNKLNVHSSTGDVRATGYG